MTYSHARTDAHMNGDCDTTTCPLCDLERTEADPHMRPCDECGEMTGDPLDCPHGRSQCPDCHSNLECIACAKEAIAEASGR